MTQVPDRDPGIRVVVRRATHQQGVEVRLEHRHPPPPQQCPPLVLENEGPRRPSHATAITVPYTDGNDGLLHALPQRKWCKLPIEMG